MSLSDRDYYKPSGFGGFSFFPRVIKSLLIINGIVFFLQVLIENITFGGVPGWYYLNRYFALNPIIGFDRVLGQEYNFQIWQLITYQFMHGDFWHIFMNMFILWMFGMEIENLWGSKKFLFFYLLCGVVGGLFQLLITPLMGGGLAPTIGASGAVYGIMVAFAMFFPDRYIFFWMLIPVKAKYLIAFWVLIEFMSVGDMSVVARLAHIGGALSSFVFIMLDRKHNFNIDRLYTSIKNNLSSKKSSISGKGGTFRRKFGTSNKEIKDATFYEIQNENSASEINQDEIDTILDKISQSGYQNLTEREKKILFEASKKQ